MLKHIAQVEVAYSGTAGVSGKLAHYAPELSRIRDFKPSKADCFFADCNQSINHILIRDPGIAPHRYPVEVSEMESHPTKVQLPFLGHLCKFIAWGNFQRTGEELSP